jgi:hypothetical protein
MRPDLIVEEVPMRNVASKAGMSIAIGAGAIAVAWGVFLPYGYPWPSLAWVVVACAAGIWAASENMSPSPAMGDVISGVEGEAAQDPAATKP